MAPESTTADFPDTLQALTDPLQLPGYLADLARRENPPQVSVAQVAKLLDVSFVTHGHGDHFNGPTTRPAHCRADP